MRLSGLEQIPPVVDPPHQVGHTRPSSRKWSERGVIMEDRVCACSKAGTVVVHKPFVIYPGWGLFWIGCRYSATRARCLYRRL